MLAPFWTIRVILIILLWPVADLVRMTVVTLACLMIVMRPFIPFFYVASFVAFSPYGPRSSGDNPSLPVPSPFGPLRPGRSRQSGTSSWAFLRPTWTGTPSMVEPQRESSEATALPSTAAAGRPQLGAVWRPGSLGPSGGGSAVCDFPGVSGFA